MGFSHSAGILLFIKYCHTGDTVKIAASLLSFLEGIKEKVVCYNENFLLRYIMPIQHILIIVGIPVNFKVKKKTNKQKKTKKRNHFSLSQ